MHMYFNNMYGNTYIWVWTCILWYVLVLVLKLWNMYSSISISCSMCMVMFARVGVKTFMILYEPLWSCMILYDPLCVYRIIYIAYMLEHVIFIYIYMSLWYPAIQVPGGPLSGRQVRWSHWRPNPDVSDLVTDTMQDGASQ